MILDIPHWYGHGQYISPIYYTRPGVSIVDYWGVGWRVGGVDLLCHNGVYIVCIGCLLEGYALERHESKLYLM